MLGKKMARGAAIGVAVLALGGGVAACGSDDNNSGDSGSSGGGGDSGKSAKIALLLPETKTARYESQDKPTYLIREILESPVSDEAGVPSRVSRIK